MEDMLSNQDLLDLLSDDSDNKSSADEDTKVSEEKEADTKLSELKDLATQLSETVSGNNPGSGDLDKDLSNWFDGEDDLPSDPLTKYVSNASVKMDYGLHKNVLSSYQLMGKLYKFINEDTFNALFSEQAILGLDSEELESRVKTAFVMFKDLANLNAKVIHDIKDYRLKSNTDYEDVDKLTLLLGSIPTEKLTKALEEISYADEK